MKERRTALGLTEERHLARPGASLAKAACGLLRLAEPARSARRRTEPSGRRSAAAEETAARRRRGGGRSECRGWGGRAAEAAEGRRCGVGRAETWPRLLSRSTEATCSKRERPLSRQHTGVVCKGRGGKAHRTSRRAGPRRRQRDRRLRQAAAAGRSQTVSSRSLEGGESRERQRQVR
jgi:hypothetical protein